MVFMDAIKHRSVIPSTLTRRNHYSPVIVSYEGQAFTSPNDKHANGAHLGQNINELMQVSEIPLAAEIEGLTVFIPTTAPSC